MLNISCAFLEKTKSIVPDIPMLKKEKKAETFNDKIVAEINKSRVENGLNPVELDYTASEAAKMHCDEMASFKFFGHLSLDGSTPYHRYNMKAKGIGHVQENLYFYSYEDFDKSEPNLLALAKKGHLAFMAETPPNDGHRMNILSPMHNGVGVAISYNNNDFYYCEEFTDNYVEINGDPSPTMKAGEAQTITGKVLSPEKYGVLIINITYENNIRPLGLFAKQLTYYNDYSLKRMKAVAPWDIKYDKDSGAFEYQFKADEAGVYYIKYYLKEDSSTIPYDGGSVNTKQGFIGGAQVFIVQ